MSSSSVPTWPRIWGFLLGVCREISARQMTCRAKAPLSTGRTMREKNLEDLRFSHLSISSKWEEWWPAWMTWEIGAWALEASSLGQMWVAQETWEPLVAYILHKILRRSHNNRQYGLQSVTVTAVDTWGYFQLLLCLPKPAIFHMKSDHLHPSSLVNKTGIFKNKPQCFSRT